MNKVILTKAYYWQLLIQVNSLVVTNSAIILSALTVFLFPYCTSYASLVIMALLFGFFVGKRMSGPVRIYCSSYFHFFSYPQRPTSALRRSYWWTSWAWTTSPAPSGSLHCSGDSPQWSAHLLMVKVMKTSIKPRKTFIPQVGYLSRPLITTCASWSLAASSCWPGSSAALWTSLKGEGKPKPRSYFLEKCLSHFS